jgi:hypothetical protein
VRPRVQTPVPQKKKKKGMKLDPSHIPSTKMNSRWTKDLNDKLKPITLRTKCQWLIPIILATQEAEIRIAVQSLNGQTDCKTPISKILNTQKG